MDTLIYLRRVIDAQSDARVSAVVEGLGELSHILDEQIRVIVTEYEKLDKKEPPK